MNQTYIHEEQKKTLTKQKTNVCRGLYYTPVVCYNFMTYLLTCEIKEYNVLHKCYDVTNGLWSQKF